MNSARPDKHDLKAARALEDRVWVHVASKNMRQAVADCEALNRQYPKYPSGWHTTSQLAIKTNNPKLALGAIDKALSLEPGNSGWLLQKAVCLARLGLIEQTGEQVQALRAHQLTTPYQCSTYAMLLMQLGKREEAVEHYSAAISLQPEVARHYYNLACVQRTLGETEAAEQNFDKAINLDPSDYEAFKLRAELRTQTPENNHVQELKQVVDEGVDDQRGLVHVCYGLAKELEDLGEWERSFHYLKKGSDTRRSYMQYDVQRDLDTMTSIQKAYPANMFDGSHGGCENTEAIFILGMPRTGTTLVERILSSHSDVFAAGELNNFSLQMMNMVKAQAGDQPKSRDDLVGLSASLDFKALGEAYITSTRSLTGQTARFIDKMPLNYLYVGLIHLALPNAKIVVLERNPLDSCYAVYKQLFVDAYPFSYDLEELGKYFVAYHRLMQHWKSVIPSATHTISYENLVSDFEVESRQLLDYCGLDWQDQCLRFHENKAASTTASTVQVRQPVYQSSVCKWRNVEAQMQAVIKILEAAGIPTQA